MVIWYMTYLSRDNSSATNSWLGKKKSMFDPDGYLLSFWNIGYTSKSLVTKQSDVGVGGWKTGSQITEKSGNDKWPDWQVNKLFNSLNKQKK